jgi:hypothetical protein
MSHFLNLNRLDRPLESTWTIILGNAEFNTNSEVINLFSSFADIDEIEWEPLGHSVMVTILFTRPPVNISPRTVIHEWSRHIRRPIPTTIRIFVTVPDDTDSESEEDEPLDNLLSSIQWVVDINEHYCAAAA